MELSKMVWSSITILLVFKPLVISRCSRKFRRNDLGMKEINFIFGKGVVVFNAVGREASGTFPENAQKMSINYSNMPRKSARNS